MVRKIAPAKAADEPKPAARVSKKSKPENFRLYINRVLKKVYPDVSISSGAAGVVNGLIFDMLQRISADAGKVVAFNKKSTMTARELEAAVTMVLPGALAHQATYEAKKAVTTFISERKPPAAAKKVAKS